MSPHLIWLFNNEFITVTYGLHRSTGDFYSGGSIILNHIKYPFVFLIKQIGILIPFIILLLLLFQNLKKLNFKDKNLIFLFWINLFLLILIFLTLFIFWNKY